MDLIKGSDGYYVIVKGKLRKIVGVEYAKDFFTSTVGRVDYKLEDENITDITTFKQLS